MDRGHRDTFCFHEGSKKKKEVCFCGAHMKDSPLQKHTELLLVCLSSSLSVSRIFGNELKILNSAAFSRVSFIVKWAHLQKSHKKSLFFVPKADKIKMISIFQTAMPEGQKNSAYRLVDTFVRTGIIGKRYCNYKSTVLFVGVAVPSRFLQYFILLNMITKFYR
jgi:hypothetical protein